MNWRYAKLDENYNIVSCPSNDLDGKIVGHPVFGLPQWFDENPEERKRLGWIKIITHNRNEIDYDKQTQYCVSGLRQIDEYTAEEYYTVLDKSEEQMLLEEMLESIEMEDGIVIKIGGLMFG